jgi:Protein of unknown function (DUF1569)
MHRDIEACRSFIDAATFGLDDERAAVRLDGRWSIAEIIEHLDRTYTGTVKGLERCLDAGAPRVSAASARGRIRRFFVVTLGWFPTGIQAPRHVVPSGEMTLSALAGRIRTHLAEMDAVLVRASERFGAGPVLDHPILGPFTAADWARFHRVHTRHHCRQIDERRRRADGRG